jgi:phage protein D
VPGDLYYRVNVSAGGFQYDLSDDLSSLTIDQTEGQPDFLTVDLSDPWKVLSHAVQEGMDVEVELGTDDDHAVVFRGRIYKVEGSFPTEQTPTLRLLAYDPSMSMGLLERNRVWADMTLCEIIKKIAASYCFWRVDVRLKGDPRFRGNGIRQQDETDLAFLRRLAAIYGCILYVSTEDIGETFHFISQRHAMETAPVVTAYYGRSDVRDRLLSFEASADVSQIELPRVLSGIDYDTGQPTELASTSVEIVGTADDLFFDENLAAFRADQPVKAGLLDALLLAARASQADLRKDLGRARREATPTFTAEDQQSAIAENQFSTRVRGMRASGSAVGIRRLVAQTTIAIGDVGGRFSGTWFLSQVRHILDEQGYRTEFECRR